MKAKEPQELFPKDSKKSYGLMALVRGKTPSVGKGPEDTVFAWPHLLIREIILLVIVFALILAAAVFINAPLEEPANPTHPPNPAKAPWYLLGLQELVSYSALIGGVLIPGLIVVGLMLIRVSIFLTLGQRSLHVSAFIGKSPYGTKLVNLPIVK